MKFSPFLLVPTIWLVSGAAAAEPTQSPPRKGEVHELTLTRDSVEQSDDGSSQGSSHDQDSIVERLLAVGGDGVELEYDLPATANADERNSQWQFPVRVLRLPDGKLRLLNGGELEVRVDRWLKAAGWPRTVCGHWIFTWNGFKIECDPQSALKAVKGFDLTSDDLRDGIPYRDADALEPGRLTRKASEHGDLFSTELRVDANAIRRVRAETDVAIGEVTNRPVTLDTALRKHANDEVTGTISVTFETDPTGAPVRRTKVTKLLSKEGNGMSKTQTITEVLERKTVPVR
jgi:hypothetical protein